MLLQQEIVNLADVSSLTENGNYYPTLLLCLKELEALKGQVSTPNRALNHPKQTNMTIKGLFGQIRECGRKLLERNDIYEMKRILNCGYEIW